jgi:hypothetical protein
MPVGIHVVQWSMHIGPALRRWAAGSEIDPLLKRLSVNDHSCGDIRQNVESSQVNFPWDAHLLATVAMFTRADPLGG